MLKNTAEGLFDKTRISSLDQIQPLNVEDNSYFTNGCNIFIGQLSQFLIKICPFCVMKL